MLSDVLNTPILAIAIDDMPSAYNSAVNAISEALPDVTEGSIIQSINNASQFVLSDVDNKLNRLFIPITDKLLPIHYASGNANNGKAVAYDGEGVPQISEAGNTVTLQFEIKNSLSKLSTISDILYGIVTKNAIQAATHPRVSFYSSTYCIFNAYLMGVSRSMVDDTDQEIVALTLEIYNNKNPDPADTPAVENVATNTATDPQVQTDENGVPEAAALNPLYQWYLMLSQDQYFDQPVPSYTADQTIRRKEYLIFRTFSIAVGGIRQLIGVDYGGIIHTMEIDQVEFYNKDQSMGITAFDGGFYLGFLL